LVIGGLTSDGWTPRVEAYDPEADLWDRRQSKPTAVANVGAAVVNGLVYVPGGTDAANRVREIVEVYDPALDIWSTVAPMPSPRCAYAIAPYGDGFYVFGGWDGRRYLDTTLYYDVLSDTWREEAPARGARGFAAARTVAGRVYVVGGYDGDSEQNLCESYDPALASSGNDPWRTHAPMRTGRAGHSMAVVRENLYVVGGGWDHPVSYNERYDVANDAWSTFESPIIGEWRSLGVTTISQRDGALVYAIGGWNGSYLAVVKAYQAFYRVYLP